MVTARTAYPAAGSTAASKKVPKKDISTWLDRNQAADLLGVSVSTLANLERRHKLTPARDYRRDPNNAERWMLVYDPRELAKIPLRDRSSLRSPGELAARAFEMFDEGKTIREIVIALRELPQTVEDLKLQWDGAGGSDRVLTPVSWDRLTALVGPFSSIADLIARVEQLVSDANAIVTGDDADTHQTGDVGDAAIVDVKTGQLVGQIK